MEGCELSFRFKLGADFLRLPGFDIIFDEDDLRTLKVGGVSLPIRPIDVPWRETLKRECLIIFKSFQKSFC